MSSINDQSVANFYSAKSIFVTSGTGFIGKLFLEKLLYSCGDIEKIYVLVRERDGKSVEERIKELVNNEAFIRIKNEKPYALSKIVPVGGDICDENLGIQGNDEQFLDKVSVVFHIAASINMKERLDLSLNANVEGTRRVLHLCRRMKRLQAYVHLSTAYTHTHNKILEEKIYPATAKLSDVYKFIREYGVEDKDKLNKVLNGQPNTYTFTKSLAENLVAEEGLDVPSVIIRPSVVSAALKEPAEGWTDTWLGASGFIIFSAVGVNRVMFAKKENVLDLIPVDHVVNLIIVAAARCNTSQKLTVYNSCSSGSNPLKFTDVFRYLRDYSTETGFNGVPFPKILFTTNETVYPMCTFMLEKLPCFFADTWRRIRGKKPRYMNMQSKLTHNRQLLKFFTTRSWVMKSDGVRSLYSSLNPQDRQTFPCDPALINWRQYIPVYLRGMKRYLLKK